MSTALELSADVPLLEARGICKRFPGVQALSDVSLRLYRGQSIALLGENGAGKSTLIGILTGVIRPDAGDVLINGSVVPLRAPREARQHGIATVFQELSLVENLTVAENLYLGREPRNALGLIDYRAMNSRAEAVLTKMRLRLSPHTKVATLRVGHRQAVEIARGLSSQARVLILDEPTSSLSDQETETLFKVLAQLRSEGVSIIYITHKLEELPRVADRLIVMRDGRVVATDLQPRTPQQDIVKSMIGRKTGNFKSQRRMESGPVVLETRSLTLPHPTRRGDLLLDDISLRVSAGEVLGIFGLVGAGRTELLEAVFGAHTKMRGEVRIDSQPVSFESSGQAIAAGVALAPEDRKLAGLVLQMTVRANATLAVLHRIARFGLLRTSIEDATLLPTFSRLNLQVQKANEQVVNLSGGNQQKVVLAKWLAAKPRVLMLDEPTRGIDINAKQEMYGLIDQLTQEGVAVILVSSELTEVLALSSRIMVMCEGRVSCELSLAEATPERLMSAALPKSARAALQ